MTNSPFSTPADILSTLRQATSDAHRDLENTINIERCIADLPRYRRLLETFLTFYRPLEARLNAVPGELDLRERQKTPWLESDLRALGSDPALLTDCPDLPEVDTVPAAFGSLYVLEGATLGGRQISALLRDSAVPEDARRFFASYGPATGARWREFLVALESHGSARTIAAAVDTFARMRRWAGECMGNA